MHKMINLSRPLNSLIFFCFFIVIKVETHYLIINISQAIEQSKRYDGLAMHSKNISGQQDLSNFARNTPISASLLRIPKKIFAPPQPPAADGEESLEYNVSV